MLSIKIDDKEFYDGNTNRFTYVKGQTLVLEHSLISISKWESKFHKSFLHNLKNLSKVESQYYVRCMTITKNVPDEVYMCLSNKNIEDINNYINDPMTGTTFSENNGRSDRRPVTNELIYYQMIEYGIPVEFERWHLNRLLTLIKVCSIKNQPPKKMGRTELANRNRALNAKRRKQLNTTG